MYASLFKHFTMYSNIVIFQYDRNLKQTLHFQKLSGKRIAFPFRFSISGSIKIDDNANRRTIELTSRATRTFRHVRVIGNVSIPRGLVMNIYVNEVWLCHETWFGRTNPPGREKSLRRIFCGCYILLNYRSQCLGLRMDCSQCCVQSAATFHTKWHEFVFLFTFWYHCIPDDSIVVTLLVGQFNDILTAA